MQKLLLSILLVVCSFFLRGQTSIIYNSKNTFKNVSLDWNEIPNQAWLGYSFWCNSYLDWKVEDNRVIAFPYRKHKRTAHFSAYQIKHKKGFLNASVNLGFSNLENSGYLGILIGGGNAKLNEKTNLLIHNNLPNSNTHLISVSKTGKLSLIKYGTDSIIYQHQLDTNLLIDSTGINLDIKYKSFKDSTLIKLEVSNLNNFIFKDSVILKNSYIPTGSIALTYSCENSFKKFGWFDDLNITGDVFKKSETTGPIISSFHTVTQDSIFITFQLQPFQFVDADNFTLFLKTKKTTLKYTNFKYDSLANQLRFRVPSIQKKKNINYEIEYIGKQTIGNFSLKGNIKAIPPKKELVVMALNCNGFSFMHEGKFKYDDLWYPYEQIEEGFKTFNPDLIVFLGDQFYESRPNMPINTVPFCYQDYLYKWNLFCLQFRDLTANTPTIILTDDHDIYQGNLWGENGSSAKENLTAQLNDQYQQNYDTWKQDNGGYLMPTNFVNMAIKSQTSHLPKPFNKESSLLTNYYTSYKYGDFDFAILEDKKFKSAPTKINQPIFNGIPLNDNLTTDQLNNKSLRLLGEKQLGFLDKFLSKKAKGIKIVLTQSAYASLTTINKESHPLKDLPATLSGKHKLNRDMDTNGWPKNGRDKALDIVGSTPTLFLAGDQHMGSVVELFDSINNGTHFFTIPSISNTWPRTWLPSDSTNKSPLGIHLDGFGNKMNVIAVANPTNEIHHPQKINKKSPGFGIIILNKRKKTALLHAYPLFFNESEEIQEYDGWPVKISLK